MKRFKKAVFGIPAAIMLAAGNAMATTPQITVPESVNIQPVLEIVAVVLVGLFAMWGIRKVIKLTNRS